MRDRGRIFQLSIYLILILTLLAGCLDGGQKLSRAEDELVLAIGAEPEEGFDPAAGWGRYGSPLFQSTLLRRDDSLRIVGDLAVSYAVEPNGLSWTVKLRKDAFFTDGQPVTAHDVKFTFDTAAGNGSVIDLTNLKQVEAADDHTVLFHLKEAQSAFISHLVSLGIVPRHAYGQQYASQPLGSGPYKLVQWNRGQQLMIEANPDYYGKKPYFKKITFLFLSEDGAYAAAKAGKVDMAYIPASLGKQHIPGMRLESAKTVDNRGIAFPTVPSGGKTEQGYPIGNDVTADLAIRQAVNIAIDRNALVRGVLEGFGTPAYTANDGLPWWNPDSAVKDADPELARKLLADAGWADRDGDKIVEKGPLKAQFTLLYPSGDSIRQSLALATADMIKPIGIDIRVEGKSWSEIEKRMHANAVLMGWGSHDPLEMYYLYSSKYRGVDFFNTGYYSNPIVDDWMERALRAASQDEAYGYWKKAQWDGKTGVSAQGDAPWAWLVNIDHLYLVNERLDIGTQRIHPHGHGWPVTDNIEQWKWR